MDWGWKRIEVVEETIGADYTLNTFGEGKNLEVRWELEGG